MKYPIDPSLPLSSHEATRLLQRLGAGDPKAGDGLLQLVYSELHRAAARCMVGERRGHTLQPTALVSEAYLKLVGGASQNWRNRTHFTAVAARAMRQILVDHARARRAVRRGGGQNTQPLDEAVTLFEERSVDLLRLEDGLVALGQFDEQLARLVELRFFGGMTHDEVASTLGVSLRTVERGWQSARAWLNAELGSKS